ncbi:hypothetical protein [Micromonospora sp. NPDC048830]|uniref:hypothetical protein n=1 Tax=Micromonospora sp. NPDC048830 TaxID=3364257 RepID=UPI0037156081
MGSSYQTVLATGDLADVRTAVAESGQDAVVIPVGDRRWAVVPAQDDGYAETEDLAELLSRPEGSVAASFDVFDSDYIVAKLFRGGRGYHDYLSDQAYVIELWDEDDNEILLDPLGRPYPPNATPPTGAYGADPAAFAPLGIAPIDETALSAALRGPVHMAEKQHHAILHALNLDPRPLQMSYKRAVTSGLGV